MALIKPRPYAKTKQKLPIHPNGIGRYLFAFLEYGKVKGFSSDTLTRRDAALRRFIQWCDERHLHHPADITKPILERYQRHLFYYRKPNGDTLTLGSQQSLLIPIKVFFKWLTKENHILYNPASELELPKKPKRLPRTILNKDDIELILQQPNTDTPIGIRDRAILETFYSTGMRRMELCNLQLHELDTRRGIVFINEGKGKKDRYIPIGQRALAWINDYLDDVRPMLLASEDPGHVFITDQGQAFSRNDMSYVVKRYMDKSGLNVIGACHLFRHACATHMLDNGADVRYVQAMLGHARLDTTEIYTHVSIEKLRQIHQATHPARLDRTATNMDTKA